MARSQNTAASIALVANDTEPTVATRKRARRAAPKVETPPVKPTVDLTHTNAKAILAATFSVAIAGKVVESTETEEAAALAYIEARDAEARAQGAKEAAGNVLRYAIGDAEEIHGEGWIATWKFQKAHIDWAALVRDLKIESEVIERYRKPESRTLLVKESAK